MKERKDVYKLPAGDTTLEWYSKAVIEMKKRPTRDPRSWNYQAGMHGFNANLFWWQGKGPFPSPGDQQNFWNQCQHGSWFFLPWHRMYLAYFEQIVGQTIVDLGGPKDWALPFWNYSDTSNPKARVMPAAFTNPGNATNGLWMEGRQSTTIPERYVALTALNTLPFTGDGRSSPLGFGGPETSFSHSGGTHGALESLPHDLVHVAIGGAMGDPRAAALDPIFWVHHANIDRLWQVWLNMGHRTDPKKASWLKFAFKFHDKSGAEVEMISSAVEDTRKVLTGYTYQGVAPSGPALSRGGLEIEADLSTPLQVVAATNETLTLGGPKTSVSLSLPETMQKRENAPVSRGGTVAAKKTFLHFENVTGRGIPPIHDVYLNVPENAENTDSYYAGSISFFGVEDASTPSLHQAGSGQHFALDITDLMNRLRALPGWDEQKLTVNLVPTQPMTDDNFVKIGRISIYSE
ncbi:MAG: tyrosinase family protein [Bacteroidetes bacterium]|nr:tyrosinase family protein [Bacteroidota bacterium]